MVSFEVALAHDSAVTIAAVTNLGAIEYRLRFVSAPKIRACDVGFTDKNVVNGRENGANLLDQDTTGARLKRFAQDFEQFVLVVSAESKLCPVFQKY